MNPQPQPLISSPIRSEDRRWTKRNARTRVITSADTCLSGDISAMITQPTIKDEVQVMPPAEISAPNGSLLQSGVAADGSQELDLPGGSSRTMLPNDTCCPIMINSLPRSSKAW